MLSAKKLSTVFTVVVVFYPILLMLSVAGPLKLGDVLLMLLCLLMIMHVFHNGGKTVWNPTIICWIVHVCVLYIIQSLWLPLDISNTLDIAHHVFAMIIIACFVPDFFDKAVGMKALRLLVGFNAILIIVQYLFMRMFGLYILEKVPNFYGGASRAFFDADHPRPFGLFSEPAAFAWTAAIYLSLDLFGKKPDLKSKFAIGVTALAMLLSKSASAIAMLGMVCGIWLVKKMLIYGKGRNYLVIGFFLVVLLGIVLVRTGGLTFFIEHIYDAKTGGISRGITGRIGTLENVFSIEEKGLGVILLGGGIFQLTGYYTGFGRQILFWGYIGTLLEYGICLSLLTKKRTGDNIVIIFACLYNFFATCMVSVAPLFWMPYVITEDRGTKIMQETGRDVEICY